MSSKISLGSIVYGAVGIGCKVLAVEGDILTVETTKGAGTITLSRVLKIEAPNQVRKRVTKFELGDRVKYIGSDFNLKKQYTGVLEVWQISKNSFDEYTCLKPNCRLTSWIKFEDLELEVAQ